MLIDLLNVVGVPTSMPTSAGATHGGGASASDPAAQHADAAALVAAEHQRAEGTRWRPLLPSPAYERFVEAM